MKDELLPKPPSRALFLHENVNQNSMGKLIQDIIEINEADKQLKKVYKINGVKYKPKPIKLYVDSYGGQAYACLGLISVMERSKTPIHTIVTGCAMSCGFMILIAGHKRFAHKYSTPLYHQVSSSSWGKLKDLQEDLVETERLQGIIEEITIRKTNIDKETLKDIFIRKADWFMSAEKALELGVVDKILN